MSFFKTREEGDFTDEEIDALERLYVYLASSYKTFKKYEQARIVSEVQGDMIASGARAFLVTDDALHVMSYNKLAEDYLEDLFGASAVEQMAGEDQCCGWLTLLLGSDRDADETGACTVELKGYTFKSHIYDRTYSNGIVDRYHWIAILRDGEAAVAPVPAESGTPRPQMEPDSSSLTLLTRSERRVAELLARGLTYQEIADELVISFHTVKKHVQSIYGKCGVNDKYQFMRWYEERR